MQPFIIYIRPSTKRNARKSDGVFYAWFRDPVTGAKLPRNRINIDTLAHRLNGGIRIHVTSKAEAFNVALEALNRKVVFDCHRHEKPRLCPYIEAFWDYDNSPYVKRKLIEGSRITRAYVKNMAQAFQKHCRGSIPEGLPLDGFKVGMMEEIKARLFDSGLSSSTINRAIESLRTPLIEAFRQELIPENIGSRLSVVKRTDREKGIMTPAEAERLIAYLKGATGPDSYERWQYLVTSLILYGGMRNSEILALTASCIEVKNEAQSFIHVRHGYNPVDGVKLPKNGRIRTTTIPTPLALEILAYSESNPGGPVFYRLSDRGKPIDERKIMESFRSSMEAIGIPLQEQKDRNLTFYSLRHFFNSRMVVSGLSDVQIRNVTGHSGLEMLLHYNHENEEGLLRQAEARSRVIPYVE